MSQSLLSILAQEQPLALGSPACGGQSLEVMQGSGKCLGDHRGRWRASGDPQIDGNDVLERPGELSVLTEEVAPEGAVAERGNEPGLGHRVVRDAQRRSHPRGDRAGDEEHVGVAG